MDDWTENSRMIVDSARAIPPMAIWYGYATCAARTRVLTGRWSPAPASWGCS